MCLRLCYVMLQGGSDIPAYRFLVETRSYEVCCLFLRRLGNNPHTRAFVKKRETIVTKVLQSHRVAQIKVTAIAKETRWNLSGNSGKSKGGSSCEGAIGLFKTQTEFRRDAKDTHRGMFHLHVYLQ